MAPLDGAHLLPDALMPSPTPQLPTSLQSSEEATSLQSVYTAAAKLFLANTYQSVSLRQISEASGVPQGSLHKLVGSKEDLLHRLLIRFESGLLEQIKRHLPRSLDCQMAMRRFTEIYITYGAAHRTDVLLARRDMHLLSPEHQEAIRKVQDKLVTRLWEITAVGQAKKIFRLPDLRFSAKVILATLEGTLANRTLTYPQLIESIPLLQVMVIQFASAGRRA